MTLLEIIGLAWLVMLTWSFVSAIKQAKNEIRAEHQKDIEKEVKEVYIDAVETNGNHFFLVYDSKTHDYIGQGKTQEEVQNNIKTRFPDVVFIINSENLQKISG